MNVPNALTLSRILLVPVFLIFLVYGYHSLALLLFVVAGLTDALDGFWARKFGQITLIGAYLDPIADKLLITVSYVSLSILGFLPAWLGILVVSKDIFVSIGAAVQYFVGQRGVFPTFWGKRTTFLQIVTVGVVLVSSVRAESFVFTEGLYILTGVVTTFSGLHYIISGIRAFPEGVDAGEAPQQNG